MCRMNKPSFLAYDDDLRRFYTVVSLQIENTPCVIGLYAVCTFFTSPFIISRLSFRNRAVRLFVGNAFICGTNNFVHIMKFF